MATAGKRNKTGTSPSSSEQAEQPPVKHPGTRKPMPALVEPMLSTLVREPFADEDWMFEVKFDGFRILAYKNKSKLTLRSRKVDYTKDFSLLVDALGGIDHDFILDGEVVALNEQGLPDFQTMQNYKKGAPLKYYVFDLLYLDGYDLTRIELTERRRILRDMLPQSDMISFSQDFEDGIRLFEAVRNKGLEGIVAKRRDSCYLPGKRSKSWLKIPLMNRQEFVIGGWTDSETGQAFRSLLFGHYISGKLTYVGHVGHGFTEDQRREILVKLQKLETTRSPFSTTFETPTKAHWIKPTLVATIEYADWTTAGNIRKAAIFKGWRSDKVPQEVFPEEPLSTEEKQQVIEADVIPGEAGVFNHADNPVDLRRPGGDLTRSIAEEFNEDSNWKELDKLEIREEHELPVEGFNVRVNNLSKVLWADGQINKSALLAYYGSIQKYILPYLKDRPLSLYIKHLSPTAPGLYIKDMEGRQPAFAQVFTTLRKHQKKGKRDRIDYLVCNNAATLIYIINLGAIDLNPWSSRTISAESPDYITIDLDPSDGDFSKAVEAAKVAKEIFDEQQLRSFVKTSGKTGLHLLIPCSGFTFPQARTMGSLICDEVHRRLPALTTRERSVSKRGNLLYVDDSQNDFADTIASAYSVRPYYIPTVSTPLEWKEVKPSLDPAAFTINTIKGRLEKKGDLLKSLFDRKMVALNDKQLREFLTVNA